MDLHFCTPAPSCTASRFNRPKDVQGCAAAPEGFAPTAFLVLLVQCVCVVHRFNFAVKTKPSRRLNVWADKTDGSQHRSVAHQESELWMVGGGCCQNALTCALTATQKCTARVIPMRR